ncbi:MAG: glycerol kinase GlpK [Bdellovibrionaceae bacterium]|nr:glycerol kinase GlpK [Pseudobdellovibrionaceae bacterium]
MAKMTSYILAIDQGTTGTTVAVVDAKGKIKAKANAEYRQIYPQPGWVEHNPEDIWKSVLSMITAAMKKARVKGTDVAAIGITNQRETVVLWDRKSGKAVHHAIVWQDRRTTAYCEELKQSGHESTLRAKTGLVIDPYFSASKIHWLLKHVSGARAKAESGALAVGTIDTFLLWRLTAGQSHKTDVSNASRTQLMNLAKGQWDDELLQLFGVPQSLLPEITASSGEFGRTKGLKILPDGIPIAGIAGDQQAALFGQTCFEVGESKCTFGTGSFLLMNTGSQLIRSTSGLLTTAAWKLKGDSQMTYALEGGAFICGAAVQFLRDQLGFIKSSAEIEKLAKSVKDSGGVEFVPALTGLGAPHWNPEARGVICGLTRGTTRAHIARATLEAMALQNTEILLAMQKDLNGALRSVRVDGGAAANNMLMQLQADYLGVDVVRPRMIETTVAGAAYLAGLGVGFWSDRSEIKKVWQIDKLFQPNFASTARAERLERWALAMRRALIR